MHTCTPTPLFHRLIETTCYHGTVDESLGFELVSVGTLRVWYGLADRKHADNE